MLTARAGHPGNELRDDKHLLRVQKQLAKLDLLPGDELGYVPFSKTGYELILDIFSRRYVQASTLDDLESAVQRMHAAIFGSERLIAETCATG